MAIHEAQVQYVRETTDELEGLYGTAIWKKGVRRFNPDTGLIDFWDGTRWVTERPSVTKGGTVLDPASRDIPAWRADAEAQVLAVRGYRVGGTGATINARKNGTDEHLSSDLSLTSPNTWMTDTTIQNAVYAAGDSLELRIKSVSGSPTEVAVQIDLYYTE